MSEEWNFYFCQVDDKPASIFVDLGIREQVPVAALPHRACLSLILKHPREDGLSSQQEYEVLSAFEDALKQHLDTPDSMYVGRNTSDGRRDFWCFVADPVAWEQRVAALMAGFAGYERETYTAEDPDWDAYLNFLYPNEEGFDFMSNGQVCDRMEAGGDPLTQARDIDHWAYFPDDTSRQAFLDQVEPLGFAVRELYERESDEGAEPDDEPFVARVFRCDTPSHRDIHDVTVPLLRAARAAGGRYDGWETQRLAPDATH